MLPKKKKLTGTEAVLEFFENCQHPLKPVLEEIRSIVLDTDPEIAEQIKWNAPAFYYNGDMKPFDPKEYKRDILVYNLYKSDQVLLVFPTGARIDDPGGLLQGNFPDGRKTASFQSLEQVKEKAAMLQSVIKNWLSTVEK